jgi:hypothetical protein
LVIFCFFFESGFGGKNFDKYRIWIDESIDSGSYCNPDDETFELGYLMDPSIRKLKVKLIIMLI